LQQTSGRIRETRPEPHAHHSDRGGDSAGSDEVQPFSAIGQEREQDERHNSGSRIQTSKHREDTEHRSGADPVCAVQRKSGQHQRHRHVHTGEMRRRAQRFKRKQINAHGTEAGAYSDICK